MFSQVSVKIMPTVVHTLAAILITPPYVHAWKDLYQNLQKIGIQQIGTPLGCNDEDGFLNYREMKLPGRSSSWFDWNMSLKECGELCWKNCSCKAYANLDIRNGGTGCLLWFVDLVDLVVLQMGGQGLYIHVAALALGILLTTNIFCCDWNSISFHPYHQKLYSSIDTS